jgi:hypothetical protein
MDGELRPFHQKIISKAILEGRRSQILLNEQLRLARMKEEDEWAELSRQEAAQSQRVLKFDRQAKLEAEKALVQTYDNELALHKKAQQKEAKEERRVVKRMLLQQRMDEEKEKQIQDAKRADLRAKIAEALEGNNCLMERKQEQMLQQEKEERKIRKEHEEMEKRQAERQALVERAKQEKDQRRQRLILAQTQKLAELKAKEQKQTDVAVSELDKRYEMERKQEEDKKKRMRADLNREWLESMRRREEKVLAEAEARYAPAQTGGHRYEEELLADERMKKLRNDRLRMDQELQIQERKMREQQEVRQNRTRMDSYFLKD